MFGSRRVQAVLAREGTPVGRRRIRRLMRRMGLWAYLRPSAAGRAQKASLVACFNWYNRLRPHQALGWQTPDEAYFDQREAALRAA